MKQLLSPVLAGLGLMFFLSNCASLSGLQDGRTVGKGNGEISASLNFNGSPAFNDIEDGIDSIDVDIPNITVPSLEFGGRMGVGEKVDVSLRFNSSLNLGLGVKAQVLGDRESKFALALGAEVGTFGLITGLWNINIPIYASVHPTDRFTWYITPRYIYQFAGFAGSDAGWNYGGGNTGFLFGNRNKFGVDFGYYRVGADGASTGLIQFGLGGKFAIGNN